MKKIIVVLLLTLVPYLLFSQKGKWNKTMDENTIEAYEEFIAKYHLWIKFCNLTQFRVAHWIKFAT